MFAYGEFHLPVRDVGINYHMIAVTDFAFQDLQGKRVLHQPLDGALQRARAEGPVIAFQKQQFLGRGRKLNSDLAVSKQSAQIVEPQFNDARELLFAQRAEHNNVIYAVQKLRAEVLPHSFYHMLGCFRERLW